MSSKRKARNDEFPAREVLSGSLKITLFYSSRPILYLIVLRTRDTVF